MVNKYSFKIKEGIAQLTIKDFKIGNEKKFNKFLKQCFTQIQQEKIDKLLVDLRGNPGGNPDATNRLLSYFIEQTVYPYKEKFTLVDELPNQENFKKDLAFKYFHKAKLKKSDSIFIVKKETKVKVTPNKKRYKGKVVFLINENCASATTSFLGQIKTHRPDAYLVGSQALGNPVIVVASYTVSLNLPNSGITVKIPLVSSEKNVSFENPASGLMPDVVISLSIEDKLLKRDTWRAKALEILQKK